MGIVDRVMDFLRSVPGVVSVFIMDDDITDEIDHVERSICTRSNHDYRNIGYDEAKTKDYRICVLHSQDHFFHKIPLVKLITTDGTVLGTTLCPEDVPKYKEKNNVLWLSDDFVVFTDAVGKGKEEFVVTSFDVPEITEAIPGCKGAIGISPTMSSDILLKSKVGISPTNSIYSTIVAFDEQSLKDECLQPSDGILNGTDVAGPAIMP